MKKVVRVIDLFSGPGGLSEGFSRFGEKNWSAWLKPELVERDWEDPTDVQFRVRLSIEKDPVAHQTLTLRGFVRQFGTDLPDDYYAFLKGELELDELYARYPEQAAAAKQEAWNFTLAKDAKTRAEVDKRIEEALKDSDDDWCLIGGPPCQAYSLVGRARNKGKKDYVPEQDERHFLYEEYLRIVAKHAPAVFVMENVKGMLSSTVNGHRIFDRIIDDLSNPTRFGKSKVQGLNYRIVPVVLGADEKQLALDADAQRRDGRQFILRAEDLGVPQARHRVILVGVRSDIDSDHAKTPRLSTREQVSIEEVLGGLPARSSSVSRRKHSTDTWRSALEAIRNASWFTDLKVTDVEVHRAMKEALSSLSERDGSSDRKRFAPSTSSPRYMKDWFVDPKLKGVTNHHPRSHMSSDLQRYFFAAAFAEVRGKSPKLEDFPRQLLPKHKNATHAAVRAGTAFADRFRVQAKGRPATTITSHISKDGHYYIHYDLTQCRALTVREAARIQTFPDNYFFCGSRTEQYHQVGNAVPPLLAVQLAALVAHLLNVDKETVAGETTGYGGTHPATKVSK